MLLNILECTGKSPTIKNYLAPNVNSAEIKKPCSRSSFIHWVRPCPTVSNSRKVSRGPMLSFQDRHLRLSFLLEIQNGDFYGR